MAAAVILQRVATIAMSTSYTLEICSAGCTSAWLPRGPFVIATSQPPHLTYGLAQTLDAAPGEPTHTLTVSPPDTLLGWQSSPDATTCPIVRSSANASIVQCGSTSGALQWYRIVWGASNCTTVACLVGTTLAPTHQPSSLPTMVPTTTRTTTTRAPAPCNDTTTGCRVLDAVTESPGSSARVAPWVAVVVVFVLVAAVVAVVVKRKTARVKRPLAHRSDLGSGFLELIPHSQNPIYAEINNDTEDAGLPVNYDNVDHRGAILQSDEDATWTSAPANPWNPASNRPLRRHSLPAPPPPAPRTAPSPLNRSRTLNVKPGADVYEVPRALQLESGDTLHETSETDVDDITRDAWSRASELISTTTSSTLSDIDEEHEEPDFASQAPEELTHSDDSSGDEFDGFGAPPGGADSIYDNAALDAQRDAVYGGF